MKQIPWKEGQDDTVSLTWVSDMTPGWGLFLSQACNLNKLTWYFRLSFESIGLSIQKTFAIDFQDGNHDGNHGINLWFQIGTILAIFDLQVTLILLIKFRVKWPYTSRVEVRNRFSRWWPWKPSWISECNNFRVFFCCFFFIYMSPNSSYQVSSHLAWRFRSKGSKYISKTEAMAAILDFPSK